MPITRNYVLSRAARMYICFRVEENIRWTEFRSERFRRFLNYTSYFSNFVLFRYVMDLTLIKLQLQISLNMYIYVTHECALIEINVERTIMNAMMSFVYIGLASFIMILSLNNDDEASLSVA